MLVCLLLVVVAGLAVGYYATSPPRVVQAARSAIAATTGARVEIESAQFGFDGSVTLSGLSLAMPETDGPAGQLFEAEQVLIKHNLASLLVGQFRIEQVTLVKPVLHVTERIEDGLYNFEILRRSRPPGPPGPPLKRMPELFVRGGGLRFGQTQSCAYELLGTAHVTGKLTESTAGPGTYRFSLVHRVDALDASDAGVALSGEVDLRRGSFAGEMERLVAHESHRAVLPSRLRQWWDRVKPVGEVASVRFGFDPDPAIGLHGQVELHDAQLTVPYGETGARMTEVSGAIGLAGRRITLSHVAGRIEDLRYVIDGQVAGLSREAPFELTVRTEPFQLAEQPAGYLLALPQHVQDRLQRFTPQGTFAISALLRRETRGGLLVYAGQVDLADAQLTFPRFNYPLREVAGTLRFDDEQIQIVKLAGRGLTGARVELEGMIAPPAPGAAVQVTVRAHDGPVDQVLVDALPERVRPVIDLFADRQAHQRLIDRGVIQTSAMREEALAQVQRLNDKRATFAPGRAGVIQPLDSHIEQAERVADTPVFDLAGRASILAEVQRSLGPDEPTRTSVMLDAAGLEVLFTHWPYPLRVTGGKLLIRPDSVTVEGIEAVGLNGGRFRFTGRVDRSGPRGSYLEPHLQVHAEAVPADAILLATLSDAHRPLVAGLGLEGVLDATGVVTRGDDGEIGFEIQLAMADGRARPMGGRYGLEEVEGKLTVERGRVKLHKLTGLHDQTRLTLAYSGDWRSGQADTEFEADVTGLNLADPFFDMLPPWYPGVQRLSGFFNRFQPTGVVDARWFARNALGSRQVERFLDVHPETFGFDYAGQRLDFESMEGAARITPEAITLTALAGSFAAGSFRIDGEVGLVGDREVNLKFDARGDRVCPVARCALPPVVTAVVDGLRFDAGYEIKGAKLVVALAGDQPFTEFTGTAELEGASATIGLPIRDGAGTLAIHTYYKHGSRWPDVALEFNANRLRAVDRLFSPLSVRIENEPNKQDVLKITGLRGESYGGTLLGTGDIFLLGNDAVYRMDLTLQDVRLRPFVAPLKHDAEVEAVAGSGAKPAKRQPGPSGTLAASLSIEGSTSHPLVRRGRGAVDIRDANLYEVPLTFALMHVLNLSIPASKAFDRATASYLIDGDRVWFDSIRFESPTIEIAGSGTMQYSTLGLNLNLQTRNPVGPTFGALSGLFSVIKDELLSIHVGGTLSDPKPKVDSFQGIKRSWTHVFGKPTDQDGPGDAADEQQAEASTPGQ